MISKIRKKIFHKKGFTLIELMIVVAIIGVLAAIAIPNFLSYQYKVKVSEGGTNLGAIHSNEVTYHAENDTYLVLPTAGSGDGVTPTTVASAGNWNSIGFQFSGMVRGIYSGSIGNTSQFAVQAQFDVDNDGVSCVWITTQALNPAKNTANNIY